MKKTAQKIHLICNAHLDPVWLWEWQEGAAEAISTFRTAAELCEKNATFVFNHNEVTLYKWVQEYAPALFRRIQKLVAAGRWHIMGGWYLQPDCNMPSGESFVRQILLGKAYFKKHFGVEPRTAINFDPFGHSRGLVQILAKSGFDSYMYGRPQAHQQELPGGDFTWVGFDGSEVMVTRYRGWYNTPLGQARKIIEERIEQNSDQSPLAILWGVGNHGGGPSRKDLRQVNDLIRKTKDKKISHSTPEAYFKELRRARGTLPKHAGDLNPWAVGCYTSQIRIKQKHRLLENELYMLEKMASAAAAQGLMKYPYDDIHQALCDLMVTEFHDILPGSSIEPVEEAAIRQADHGLEIASRLKARAFFSLSAGQKKAKEGEIPILVYNPHPFSLARQVECEFQLADLNTEGGFYQVDVYQGSRKLDTQVEREQCNLSLEWRKRVVFAAELAPGMNRFDCRLRKIAKKPAVTLKTAAGKIIFKTSQLEVLVNARTGFIDRYRVGGVDYVDQNAFEPLVMADDQDPWGMITNSFPKIAGRFKLMGIRAGTKFSGIKGSETKSVRIIEDGPVRSVVEVVLAYQNSQIVQRYKLPKRGTEIQVETQVHWGQKDQMLKLSVPTKLRKAAKYLGQTAYGIQELPCDGTEAVSQKWQAVVAEKDNLALSCIDDGIYGSDFSPSAGLRLTLLRSPAYSAHPHEYQKGRQTLEHMPTDRYLSRSDQGLRCFKFWFNAGKLKSRIEKIDREALVKNEKPMALSFFPSGQGKKPKPMAVLSDDVVQISTIKRAERNSDIIVRLFEPTGKARSTTLSMPAIGKVLRVNLGAFEVKTLRINPRSGLVREVDLLEK
jgi:alpha-mannosidase